jgi:hypothetical protein
MSCRTCKRKRRRRSARCFLRPVSKPLARPAESSIFPNELSVGAEAGTRTPMALRPLAPEASASANSATSAGWNLVKGRNIEV